MEFVDDRGGVQAPEGAEGCHHSRRCGEQQ